MAHSDYGRVKNNPGEVLALIKTTEDLEAMGNKHEVTKLTGVGVNR
jgi:hypothetical protein